MMENCAEVTYPVPEDLSMGLMFIGSNLLGLVFIFILQVKEPLAIFLDTFHLTLFLLVSVGTFRAATMGASSTSSF